MSLVDDVRAYLEGTDKEDGATEGAGPFATTGIAAQYDELEGWIRARQRELLEEGDSFEVQMEKYMQAHREGMARFFPKEPEPDNKPTLL